jgi:primosomal protein N' (replication factor Y) (superfamily II helicase)
MNSAPIVPPLAQEKPVTQLTQQTLFEDLGSAPAQAVGLFAEVVFDRPLDHAYTYAVPERLRESIGVGKRVQAPFGKGDRATVGYCVHLTQTPPARPVKELLRVLDDEPLFNPNLLRLTRWMADYYLCGWGQVLNAVVPAGAKDRSGTRATVFLDAVPEAERPQPAPKLTPKQSAALEVLTRQGKPVELRKLCRLAQCGAAPVDVLVEKGLARRIVRRVETVDPARELARQPEVARPGSVELNPDQQKAWAELEPALRQGGFRAFLLHGVTGSGKTELYLRAIEEVVKKGKEALVLVPEISLTPQTIQCFRGRCREVAVLHSHLGNAERGGHWRRISSGLVQVVVGARSAVFAPARNLGLIVIDEEHEGSFKQEATPRYHARDVAVMRARLEGIPIVLGSATPSLESWHNAERGQYTRLVLPARVLDRPLPHVGLIDLRHDLPRGAPFQALSPALESGMRHALGGGGQVILLLNRRGFSTHIHCPGCGAVESCKFCDLALTFHRERHVLLCHHCGFEKEPPQMCARCGQVQVRYQGLGTEKLQAEIQEKFPGFVVERMDSDTMKKPGSHAKTLAAFRRGEIHILMGTQMIAKGLDFPNVTLVGVVNADVGLHLPDFRAAERTFQLLAQVSGRAGRGPRGGRVLVQTFNPEHPSIALAAAHDYERFVAVEMAHRKAHKYPPYQRLARLIVRGRDQGQASEFADRLAVAFQTAQTTLKGPDGGPLGVRILGPAEAPVFRLKGYYRFHFQLQSPSPAALHQVLRAVLPTVRTPSGVEFTLDVDPLDML